MKKISRLIWSSVAIAYFLVPFLLFLLAIALTMISYNIILLPLLSYIQMYVVSMVNLILNLRIAYQ
jgi:hypothetical protein